MSEITLESLAARLDAVEKTLGEMRAARSANDWRWSAGTTRDDADTAHVVVDESHADRESDQHPAD